MGGAKRQSPQKRGVVRSKIENFSKLKKSFFFKKKKHHQKYDLHWEFSKFSKSQERAEPTRTRPHKGGVVKIKKKKVQKIKLKKKTFLWKTLPEIWFK